MLNSKLSSEISSIIEKLNTDSISDERKVTLDVLKEAIQRKLNGSEDINIIFICTHNSRRSVLSEVWCNAIAMFNGIKNLKAYSGGTESTAVFKESLAALQSVGFKSKNVTDGNNPEVEITFGVETEPILTFSKVYDHESNPNLDFIAVMTCDSANEACPIIPNASDRVALTYKDPKAFDGTDLMSSKYIECSELIATELTYVFSSLKK